MCWRIDNPGRLKDTCCLYGLSTPYPGKDHFQDPETAPLLCLLTTGAQDYLCHFVNLRSTIGFSQPKRDCWAPRRHVCHECSARGRKFGLCPRSIHLDEWIFLFDFHLKEVHRLKSELRIGIELSPVLTSHLDCWSRRKLSNAGYSCS